MTRLWLSADSRRVECDRRGVTGLRPSETLHGRRAILGERLGVAEMRRGRWSSLGRARGRQEGFWIGTEEAAGSLEA